MEYRASTEFVRTCGWGCCGVGAWAPGVFEGITLRTYSLMLARSVLAFALCGLTGGSVFAAEQAPAGGTDPAGREALFDDEPLPGKLKPVAGVKSSGAGVKGYIQLEVARTVANPEHWSKLRTRGELATQGNLGDGIKYKLSARADYDAIYDVNGFYPPDVRKDQRSDISLRENYLDISAGDWDFRVGRQHVVWGEMVGLFFADVVSARDLHEFILPEFEAMRIPQWAARAEYFKDDFHGELLWVPVASYDQIGKPGGEFYPLQPVFPGFSAQYRQELRPERNLDHANYGARLSLLKNGWDASVFYYSSMDVAPTFYRQTVLAPVPTQIFQARHDRIEQVGGTVAKDFGSVVLKAEAVYTGGRKYTVMRLADADGLVKQDTVDWAVGFDFTLPADNRFNVQYYQRAFLNYDAGIIPDRHENGYSLYLTSKLSDKVESQLLFISSLNRSDWMFRPKLTWNVDRNWRFLVGADIFNGPALGMFGRYDQSDRVYSEVRYSF